MKGWAFMFGVFVSLFISVGTVHAETISLFYIRPDAIGLGNGSDWANAFTSIPSTLTRGATYYVAAGVYSSMSIASPVSGTTWVNIKKSTVSDHGTQAGWQDSYGTGQVLINGSLSILSPYVDFNGITGIENSNYGVKIIAQDCLSSGTKGIFIDQNMGNVYISHIEVQLCGPVPFAQDAVYAINTLPTAGQHFSYLYLHDVTRNGFSLYNQNGDTIIEHCRLEQIAGSPSNPDIHGQAIQLTDAPMNDITIRFNEFININGTAAVALLGSSGGLFSNIFIYGNIFWSTDKSQYSYSPAAIYGREGSNSQSNVLSYNNTFYNISNPNTWMTGSVVNNSQNRNNIYVNSNFQFPNGLQNSTKNPNSTNNFYFNNTGGNVPLGETGQVNGTTSPFVKVINDYHLSANSEAIGKGVNFSSSCSQDSALCSDIDGNLRGLSGNWDVGAHAYTISQNAPSTYTLSVITSGSGVGEVFSSDGNIHCGINASPTNNCSESVNAATTVTLTAIPANNDYVFSGWSGACSGIGSCAVSMKASMNVTATFKQTKIITVSSGPEGTISPSSSLRVTSGASVSFSISHHGYIYSSFVSVDGASPVQVGDTFTLRNITAAHTVAVSFIRNPRILSSNVGTGGIIRPTGATVPYGTNQSFTITPSTGHTIQSVSIDGLPIPVSNTHTFTKVITNHTISASFTPPDVSGPNLIMDFYNSDATAQATVYSIPAGISCSNKISKANQCVAAFPVGSKVLLRATSLNKSEVNFTLLGACIGGGTACFSQCTGNSCLVNVGTMDNGDREIYVQIKSPIAKIPVINFQS